MNPQHPFDRHERIADEIAHTAAKFIREEANTSPLITVTNVTIAPDYRRATIYFTTIPDSGQDDALIFLKRKAKDFRTVLKKTVRLKYIPHIEFMIDYGERHRQHIDTLFHEDAAKHPKKEVVDTNIKVEGEEK